MKTKTLLAAIALALLSAPSARAAGGPGSSLFFNGANNYVSVPHAAGLNAYPLTVTAWIKTSQTTNIAALLHKIDFGVFSGYDVSIQNGSLYAFYMKDSTAYVNDFVTGVTGGFVADGAWHHIAFVVDAAGGRLYVDGTLKGSLAWQGTPGPPITTRAMLMGDDPASSYRYFGLLDEVAVWNVALLPQQLQSNRNRSLTGTEAGLVAYYRCDGGASVLDDAAAGGNNSGTWRLAPAYVPSDLNPFSPGAETLSAGAFENSTSATLYGSAHPGGTNTSAWFQWGTTTNYGSVTTASSVGSGTSVTNFSVALTGLTARLTYHFRAVASNALGVAFGTNQSFVVISLPPVRTLPATATGPTTGTFNGVAYPGGMNSSVWFEWGTTTNYGNTTSPQAVGAGSSLTNFSETVANLFPGGTFHFRAMLSNGVATMTGGDRSFTTPFDALADRVLAGGVLVTVQPPEAVTDGARWTLDNGPEMFSGLAQEQVTPGRHTVRFRNLHNWIEPVPVEVYVVGGRTSAVSVVFSPVPAFAIGTVPEQHARAGQTIEFLVNGVPPGASLQVAGVPPPAGSLTFDPLTGRVSYAPTAADRVPFTLAFSVNGTLAATSTVTPLQTLPPEEAVISYDRPLPNDESRDYITISENLSAAEELFNNMSRQMFTVDISGKTLVFETTHPAQLHRIYNARENIKELRLYADRVIIRSPLVLPQTHVTIHARELRFEGNGSIDTTPRSQWTKPRAVTWADDDFIGFPGSPGHHGGDADIFVERFHADPSPSARFVLRGGDGGPAGEGRDGVFEGGLDPVFFPGYPDPNNQNYAAINNWLRLMARAGNSTNCGISNNRLRLYSERRNNGALVLPSVCGSQTAEAQGERAVSSGIPGAGGSGGTLRSTLDLSAYASQPGGGAGTSGGNYVGGTLVYQYVYEFINSITVGPNPGLSISYTPAPRVPGASATAPANTNGAPGSVVVIPNPSSWLHSFGLRAIVRFAKDAYLNGRVTETRALISEYRDLLEALQPAVGSVTNLNEAEFAETTSLDQVSQEMGSIVDRIDMNLDYFGNPAGWVPMLSFEANLTAFQDEINRSIPILYLAYWMNYSATNLQNSALASEEALRRLREELTKLVEAYNLVQTSLPGLRIQSANIQERIAGLHARLQFLELELEARAEQNVEERHKVPFWKKAIGVLAVAADLVPVGQPTVGRIGEGLKRLTQIDPEHPVQSALRITNAFNVFSNKDVRICFSGSSTNGTNAASRSERKEQIKALTTCGKYLKSEFEELASVFKDVQVDSGELQAEIEKLKASDPVFQQITADLVVLNEDKERFAAELAAALQAIATLASDMTENVLASDEMENRVAQQFATLDHNALVHIKEMERRAKDRLLKFQYFTAQAFQYRLLQGFDGDFQLNTLFARFQDIVAGPNAHVLTAAEFNNLKQLFQADLANTIGRTMTALNADAPVRELPRTFSLSAAELQTLNTTDHLTVNLARRGLFPSTHEDIRIVNLRVAGIRAHPVGGPLGQDAVLFLDFNHLGESRLSRNGQNFRFRHYQSATVSPIAWNAVFDAVHNTTNNSVLSASSGSLLRALLSQPTDANMLLFSRPAADADLLIRREVLSDTGLDLALDQLTIELEYEYANQNPAHRTLDVTVNDDLQPVISLNQPDAAGRRDGQGDFRRVYPANISLTLQAPVTYGGRPFDRWVINNVPRPAGSNSATFTLTTGTSAEARYADIPSSNTPPGIVQPPTNVVAVTGATATFSVVASGTGPLSFRWQKNGAPLADGGRISGAASATLVLSNVGLSDTASYSVVVSNSFGTATSAAATLSLTGPVLALLPAPSGTMGFQFQSLTGQRYIIERKFTLTDPVWIPVETNTGTGGLLPFTRPTTAAPSSYFRLRVE